VPAWALLYGRFAVLPLKNLKHPTSRSAYIIEKVPDEVVRYVTDSLLKPVPKSVWRKTGNLVFNLHLLG
jgi:hypothetical protein